MTDTFQNAPLKSLGQHWLNDPSILDAIIDEGQVAAGDIIVEIGPGQGTLTEKLLARGARVIAIEFDTQLIAPLRAKFSSQDVEIIEADILKFDLTSLPEHYKIVANIPYYLTSQLLRILSDSSHKPDRAALLMQKEVSERVAATPNDMSILTVAMQIEFQTSLGTIVPPRFFTPPPKVDSQVLLLTALHTPLVANEHKKDFMRIVKAGFSAKRKTLRNTISAGLQLSKEQAEQLLSSVTIEAGRRAETLSVEEWLQLYNAFSSNQS